MAPRFPPPPPELLEFQRALPVIEPWSPPRPTREQRRHQQALEAQAWRTEELERQRRQEAAESRRLTDILESLQSPYLPTEILQKISKRLPLGAQPAFRAASRTTASLKFNPAACCSPPTTYEIATYLFEQQRLISTGRPSRILSIIGQSVSQVVFTFSPPNIDYEFIPTLEDSVTISILKDARPPDLVLLIGGVEPKTRDDILRFLSGKELILQSRFSNQNWMLIREILSRRESCRTAGLSSDECFISMLAKSFPGFSLNREIMRQIFEHRAKLRFILKDPKFEEVFEFLTGHANEDLNQKLSEWLSSLKPSDLV